MKVLFIEYPKCSTCQKAKRWLEENNISYIDRHIVDDNPTKSELGEWIAKSGIEVKKLFNTSGMIYRQMQLKDKLPHMTFDEQLELLASNGMLVKRPLVIGDDFVLAGFREKQWTEKFLQNVQQ